MEVNFSLEQAVRGLISTVRCIRKSLKMTADAEVKIDCARFQNPCRLIILKKMTWREQ